jgi:cell division protein FtsB
VRWDRVGRVALTLVLLGVIVSYLNPVVNLIDAWRDSNAGKQELAELQAENAKLEQRVRDAATPAVLEREARKLGMARPGEHAFVIKGLPE